MLYRCSTATLYRRAHSYLPIGSFFRLPNCERYAFLLHQPIEPGPCMRYARDNLLAMPKMIQIRNVPDELHRKLKARAARLKMTLSDYLLSEIEQTAEKPALSEMMERLRNPEPVELDEPPEVTIRRCETPTSLANSASGL
jgi:antitoxin FitA